MHRITFEPWQPKLGSKFILSQDVYDDFAQVTAPNAPASVLLGVAETRLPYQSKLGMTPRRDPISGGAFCLLEAVAAHPNTPPRLLSHLLAFEPLFARAFCCNPVAPLVLLEMPHFPLTLPTDAQLALLCQAQLPASLLALVQAANPAPEIQEAARMHVAVAGEMPLPEWPDAVRDYFKSYCTTVQDQERQWHFDLAEVGLVPSWARGGVPFPAPITRLEQHPWMGEWFRFAHPQGSPKERLLIDQINPDALEVGTVLSGLRADATGDALMQLAHLPLKTKEVHTRHRHSLVMQAVLCHPNTNAAGAAVARTANARNGVPLEELTGTRRVDAALVRDALQNEDPVLRRAARRSRYAPPDAAQISRAAYATLVENGYTKPLLPLVSLGATLQFIHQWKNHTAERKSHQLHWSERLEAVLVAAAHPDLVHGLPPSRRTSRELITHLAYDGNRIVRAVAQTYLANPTFRFTL